MLLILSYLSHIKEPVKSYQSNELEISMHRYLRIFYFDLLPRGNSSWLKHRERISVLALAADTGTKGKA